MRWAALGLISTIVGLGLGQSVYAKTPACGAMGKDAIEVARNMRSCLTVKIACAAVDGSQVFGNNEGRLPTAGANQTYMEGRVGTDRAGLGGVRRLVMLVQDSKAKSVILSQYYTSDHYGTFCELNGK
jgi:guanyl-specific ribonuclease Sa